MKTTPKDGHCEKLLAQLSAYVDDELPADECRRLVEHLVGCRDCEELVEDLKRTVQRCAAEKTVHLTADLRARARARIRKLLAGQPNEA